MSEISNDEYRDIGLSLIENHSVFYLFWSNVRPRYSDTVETAAVSFNKEYECIDFLINKNFWCAQTEHNKKFIICHECLHIIFSHARRVNSKFDTLSNQAMDIVVNEALAKYFNFNRCEIDKNNEYCWLDTCFKNNPEVEKWRNFEYYLNLLLKKQSSGKQSFKLINDHSGLKELPENIVKKITGELSEEDIESLNNISKDAHKNELHAGTGTNSEIKNIICERVNKKRKWELIIKKFEKNIKKIESEEYHWIGSNRRLASIKSSLFLPSDIEESIRRIKSEKIQTWFFMDTSGSCWGLADRFFKAAKSLDPEVFDVKYFFFDTKVYNADISKKQVIGGGGTSFSCIFNFIASQRKNLKFPYVWILTDGFGDKFEIKEKDARKCSWFLTENNATSYIPKNSKIFFLKDFE